MFQSFIPALVRPALLALVCCVMAPAAQAQHHSAKRYHYRGEHANTSFWNGTAIDTPTPAEQDDEDYVRNHGTGVKLGAAWAGFRQGFEVGAFHQQRLGQVGSVQVEALYYRQPTATHPVGGLRMPLLLVLNPFDNASIHFGPQVQWQPSAVTTGEATAKVASKITTAMVMGAEMRLYCARVGMRFALPTDLLTDPKAVGNQLADQWTNSRMQVYVGIGIE